MYLTVNVSFLALGFASVLLTAVPPTPTPGLLMDIPSVKTGQQLYITSITLPVIQAHSHTHAYGGAAQLEVGHLTVSASRPSALNINMLPSWCENAAEAIFSTPHSCLTTPCPTHRSPAHANLCPIRMHRLTLGSIHSDKFILLV